MCFAQFHTMQTTSPRAKARPSKACHAWTCNSSSVQPLNASNLPGMDMPMLMLMGRVGAVGNTILMCGRLSWGPTGAQPLPGQHAFTECEVSTGTLQVWWCKAEHSHPVVHVSPPRALGPQSSVAFHEPTWAAPSPLHHPRDPLTCISQSMQHDQGRRVATSRRLRDQGSEHARCHVGRVFEAGADEESSKVCEDRK